MIVVMSSKWVADSFGKEGIYALWIAMRRYPWVSSTEYRDGGRTSVSYMTPADNVTLVDEDVSTVGHLSALTLRS
jgi:chloride channel 3/4/5